MRAGRSGRRVGPGDSPEAYGPTIGTSDRAGLVGLVDHIVLVVRRGALRRAALTRLVEGVAAAGQPVSLVLVGALPSAAAMDRKRDVDPLRRPGSSMAREPAVG